ncbi:hypothetical protein ES705_34315 [subsurface metagenome]
MSEAWEIAIGIGTTPAWADNLTLENEYARADATVALETGSVPYDTIVFDHIFEFTEIVEISEFGVFRKDTGNMLCRWVVSPVTAMPSFLMSVLYRMKLVEA